MGAGAGESGGSFGWEGKFPDTRLARSPNEQAAEVILRISILGGLLGGSRAHQRRATHGTEFGGEPASLSAMGAFVDPMGLQDLSLIHI